MKLVQNGMSHGMPHWQWDVSFGQTENGLSILISGFQGLSHMGSPTTCHKPKIERVSYLMEGDDLVGSLHFISI